jgi:hypothetical protein
MNDDNLLFTKISEANEHQMDALWAILKYRDMGILRKIQAMCEVLGLNKDEVISNLPQDENGRIYDSKNRFLLSRALLNNTNNIHND